MFVLEDDKVLVDGVKVDSGDVPEPMPEPIPEEGSPPNRRLRREEESVMA